MALVVLKSAPRPEAFDGATAADTNVLVVLFDIPRDASVHLVPVKYLDSLTPVFFLTL